MAGKFEPEREKIGLPARIILYTPDQIGAMLSMDEKYVRRALLFYEGREPGLRPKDKLNARNIAPDGEKPEWRVTEKELIRYLRLKGIKFYEQGYVM